MTQQLKAKRTDFNPRTYDKARFAFQALAFSNRLQRAHRYAEARTGPIMLKEALKKYSNVTGDVRLLSGEYFYSVDWREDEGQAVRTSFDLGDRVRHPNFFCGTFWTHGWSYYPDERR